MEQLSEPSVQRLRKRGRPSGKNRAPLSLEERRARNAQYERERREEQSQAAAMLAEAAGLEPNLSIMLLVSRVTSYLKKEAQRDSSDDVEALRSLNEKLMSQITTLEESLRCVEADSTDITLSCCHGEIPVRTHSNKIDRKRYKLDNPCPSMYHTPISEPCPEQPAALDTLPTLESVLDDVISLEEEKKIKQEMTEYSEWSSSNVLDSVISFEERKTEQQVPDYSQWSATDFTFY